MTIRKINYTVIAPEVEQEIKDKYTKVETDGLLNEKSDKTHNHNLNDLSEKSYNSLDNIPSEFNPTQHTHIEGEITDLDKYTKNEVDNKLSQKQNNIGYIPENIANKGIANGYASLDSNTKIPLSQLPDTAKQQTYVVNSETERLALSSLIEGDKCFEVSTGDSYIWNGTEWLISAKADWENVNLQWVNIIDKPNSSVSNIDDAVDKKHEHNNLTLLQSITQTLIDRWNSAWEHISDTIKHITSAERTLWNTVSNKAEQSDLNTHTSNGNIHVTTTNKNVWNNKAEISDIPTKVSELDNDSGYINDISNKADLSYVDNQLDTKVDKVTGKQLSTNDYTNVDKDKLTNIEENANNYSHPSSHSADMITETTAKKWVSPAEKDLWNSKAEGNHTHSQLHSHNNKSILDKIIQTGSENNFDLSNFVTQDDLGDAGYGDMLKNVYDKNNDGKVDISEDAEKLGGKLPSYYASKNYVDDNSGLIIP